jgi:hypothetical protein
MCVNKVYALLLQFDADTMQIKEFDSINIYSINACKLQLFPPPFAVNYALLM